MILNLLYQGTITSLSPLMIEFQDTANSPYQFELADYNKIQLTQCRRADDTLYDLIKFDNVPKHKSSDNSDFTEINDNKNDVKINLCFTNEKRKETNQIKLIELYNRKGRRRGLNLDALSHDERSQAAILYKGVPIISKITNEDIGIIKN